ncbi:hypothetical protein CLAFUW4_12385 [Fulvia fulva]|uniref:Uncharacterized protein n=1 Tax=Passalora fulva TaxID=5499 RepID=A0A9Q8USK8_PASFU|nr:uncharacterized protein CLAFUR5_11414 [Fulvia fulva]KAK4617909.1 hypothetical protein CLAFUR4_12390 [Fulvia fulva]UJO20934.1 hypothetical protein CLAFUR5_11414 [Fulvia fulva]WPV18259.1 hypothetical protein CLAFUW4_12385 [Fulvia fulva]WPV33073.1 hypothetical protein CLAFUW7_12392 [Fulvia fulva]
MATTMTQTVTETQPLATMVVTEPTPIMLIGLTARFGNFVSRKLKPEYEVIHFVSDITLAKRELALVMSGASPTIPDTTGVSTGNFSRLPRHIIFGKGFQWPVLQEVRESAGNEESGVCWYWAPQKEGDLLIKPGEIGSFSDEAIERMSEKVVGNMKRVLGGGGY